MTLSLFEDAPTPDPVPVALEPWRTYDAGAAFYLGDCLEVLRLLPARCLDAWISDPPYGIGFMNEEWDTFDIEKIEANARKAFKAHHGFNLEDPRRTNPNLVGRQRSPAMSPSQIEYDRSLDGQRAFQAWCAMVGYEVLRVLKPGAYAAICGAPRSVHRMTSGVEDAGFDVRDSIAWIFGQGFPKSLNLEGGLGTALKPAHEPIVIFRKPFDDSVEDNVARWGTGALRIEDCRLPVNDPDYARNASGDRGHADNRARQLDGFAMTAGSASEIGRWPPNVALDEIVAGDLDAMHGVRTSGANPTRRGSEKFRRVFGRFEGQATCVPARGQDAGGVSCYFFCPKPSRAERDFGCEVLEHHTAGAVTKRKDGSAGLKSPRAGAGRTRGGKNFHPTVKPVALMRWLVRLLTPPGGAVLDTCLGSGTTAMACALEGVRFVGIENKRKYLPLADARLSAVLKELHS